MSWISNLLSGFGGGGQQATGNAATAPDQNGGMNPVLAAMVDQLRRQRSRERDQSRAEQGNQFFQQMYQTPGQGNYQPRQQGGLYPTVQKYSRDWEGLGNKAMGAIGSYLSGRQSDKIGNEIDEERIPGIMDAVNKLGDPNRQDGSDGGPNDSALRAYLNMAGGKDFANLTRQRRLQSTKEDDNGYIWNIYNDGTRENTGVKANYNIKTMNDADGNVYSVGTSGAGRGKASPVMQQLQELFKIGTGAPPLEEESAPPIDRDTLHQRQMMQESSGDQSAVSTKGARGLMQLMPATARELEQRLGLPAGSTDTDAAANERAGRVYMDDLLKKNNGDNVRALVDYNWGMGNAANWNGDPATLPKETRDYVQKILGDGAFGPRKPAQQPTAIPFRQQTAAEKAASETAAKAQAEAANVGALATVKGAETMASEQAKNTAAAQDGLGKVKRVGESVLRAIDELENDPGLSEIVGGKSMYSRVDDKMADRLIPLIAAGTPAANAYAKYKNLQGSNFLQAFESLKGGGQITEKEGEKAEAAFARLQRSQSEQSFRSAMADLKSIIREAIANAERKAAGGSAPAAAPRSALPAGWSVKVK